MINYECWVFATEPEPRTTKRLHSGTLISVQNDTCNVEVTIKQQIILIKQAFPIVPTDKRHEKLGCTPFYAKHLHRICHSFVTVSPRNRQQSTLELLRNAPSQAGGCVCLPTTVWALRGCVASAMMMYAHLPWLLASGLTAETVGTSGGRERKGWDGHGSREGAGRGVDTSRGNAGGRGGEEGAKEPESCIHY